MEKAIVIHVITKMELGGAQQNTLFTITHLDRERFQPFLITGQGGELFDEAASEFKNLFVASDMIREIHPLKDLQAFLQIVKIIKKIKNDYPTSSFIVHTHSSKAGILGRWAAKAAGMYCVITTNGYTLDEDFGSADAVFPELGDPPNVLVTLSTLKAIAR